MVEDCFRCLFSFFGEGVGGGINGCVVWLYGTM